MPDIVYLKIDDKLEFRMRDNFSLNIETVNSSDKILEKPVVLSEVEMQPATMHFIQVKVRNEELELPICNEGETDIVLKIGDHLCSVLLVKGSIPEFAPRTETILEQHVL